VPALLSRKGIEPDEVLEEMEKLAEGRSNRFTGKADWIHNNFVGCLLQLYAPFARPCPFYAGFNTFCYLARGNLRHFLELCYTSLSRAADDPSTTHLQVSPLKQAEAARLAATGFLGEVRSFGTRGEQLHAFVLRVGALFAIAHARPSQSEPEQNHFSITRGIEDLTADDQAFLREATKWSVLFEEAGTKTKDPSRPDPIEYVLNPIYSPYFYISYRKRRKLELSTSHVICLMRGSVDQFSILMRDFAKRWDVGDTSAAPVALPLFTE
jgi:hypothetical protein